MEEEVGNSCKWTCQTKGRTEGTTIYWASTVNSCCSKYFHLHSQFNPYNPYEVGIFSILQRRKQSLREWKQCVQDPQPAHGPAGCGWTNPGLALQLLFFTLLYTDSQRKTRKADPLILGELPWEQLSTLTSHPPPKGGVKRPSHAHTWTMGVHRDPRGAGQSANSSHIISSQENKL